MATLVDSRAHFEARAAEYGPGDIKCEDIGTHGICHKPPWPRFR